MVDLFKNGRILSLFTRKSSQSTETQVEEEEKENPEKGAKGSSKTEKGTKGKTDGKAPAKSKNQFSSSTLIGTILGHTKKDPTTRIVETAEAVKDEVLQAFGFETSIDSPVLGTVSSEDPIESELFDEVDRTERKGSMFANAIPRNAAKNVELDVATGFMRHLFKWHDDKGNNVVVSKFYDNGNRLRKRTSEFKDDKGQDTEITENFNDKEHLTDKNIENDRCIVKYSYTNNEKGNPTGIHTEVMFKTLNMAQTTLVKPHSTQQSEPVLLATRDENITYQSDGEKREQSNVTIKSAAGSTVQTRRTNFFYYDTGALSQTHQEVTNYSENEKPNYTRTITSNFRENDHKLESQDITVSVDRDEDGHSEYVTSHVSVTYNYRDDGTLSTQVTTGYDLAGHSLSRTLNFDDDGGTVVSADISYSTQDRVVVERYEGDNVLNRVRGSLPTTSVVSDTHGNTQYKIENNFEQGVLASSTVTDKDGNVSRYDFTQMGEKLVVVSPREDSQVVALVNALKEVEGGEEYIKSLIKVTTDENGQKVYSVDFVGAKVVLDAVKQKIVQELNNQQVAVSLDGYEITPEVVRAVVQEYGLENIIREYNAQVVATSAGNPTVTIPTGVVQRSEQVTPVGSTPVVAITTDGQQIEVTDVVAEDVVGSWSVDGQKPVDKTIVGNSNHAFTIVNGNVVPEGEQVVQSNNSIQQPVNPIEFSSVLGENSGSVSPVSQLFIDETSQINITPQNGEQVQQGNHLPHLTSDILQSDVPLKGGVLPQDSQQSAIGGVIQGESKVLQDDAQPQIGQTEPGAERFTQGDAVLQSDVIPQDNQGRQVLGELLAQNMPPQDVVLQQSSGLSQNGALPQNIQAASADVIQSDVPQQNGNFVSSNALVQRVADEGVHSNNVNPTMHFTTTQNVNTNSEASPERPDEVIAPSSTVFNPKVTDDDAVSITKSQTLLNADNIIVPDNASISVTYSVTEDELQQIMQKGGTEYSAGSPEIAILEYLYDQYVQEIEELTGIKDLPQEVAGLMVIQEQSEEATRTAADVSFAVTGVVPKKYDVRSGGDSAPKVYIEDDQIRILSEDPESFVPGAVQSNSPSVKPVSRVSRSTLPSSNTVAHSGKKSFGRTQSAIRDNLTFTEIIELIKNGEIPDFAAVVQFNVAEHPVGAQTVREGKASFNIVGITENDEVILKNNITGNDVSCDDNNLIMTVKDLEKASTLITLIPVNRFSTPVADPENTTTIYNGGARVASASGGSGSNGGGDGGNNPKDAPEPPSKNRIPGEENTPTLPPNIFT